MSCIGGVIGRTHFLCLRPRGVVPARRESARYIVGGGDADSNDAVVGRRGLDSGGAVVQADVASNRDFANLFEKAIFADCAKWPRECIVINGMSANSGMKWSLREARELLGYQPVDDVNG